MNTQSMRTSPNFMRAWMRPLGLILTCAALCLSPAALAQLTIEITGGGANRIPIAIAPFAGGSLLPQAVVGVVRADLERSGLFRMIETGNIDPPPTEAQNVNYGDWKARAADQGY